VLTKSRVHVTWLLLLFTNPVDPCGKRCGAGGRRDRRVALEANAEASSSEATDASTITEATFTLTNPDGNPVTATLGYDPTTYKGTSDPTENLEAGRPTPLRSTPRSRAGLAASRMSLAMLLQQTRSGRSPLRVRPRSAQ
jgi:hypothetical protein